jgi:hypothetical protein
VRGEREREKERERERGREREREREKKMEIVTKIRAYFRSLLRGKVGRSHSIISRARSIYSNKWPKKKIK